LTFSFDIYIVVLGIHKASKDNIVLFIMENVDGKSPYGCWSFYYEAKLPIACALLRLCGWSQNINTFANWLPQIRCTCTSCLPPSGFISTLIIYSHADRTLLSFLFNNDYDCAVIISALSFFSLPKYMRDNKKKMNSKIYLACYTF